MNRRASISLEGSVLHPGHSNAASDHKLRTIALGDEHFEMRREPKIVWTLGLVRGGDGSTKKAGHMSRRHRVGFELFSPTPKDPARIA